MELGFAIIFLIMFLVLLVYLHFLLQRLNELCLWLLSTNKTVRFNVNEIHFKQAKFDE